MNSCVLQFTILCQQVNWYQQHRGRLCLPWQGPASFGLSGPEDEIVRPRCGVDYYISVYMTSYTIAEESSSKLM